MYVPTKRTSFLRNKLINASKVGTFIFNEESGGQYHCQVGNKSLTFEKVISFLN